ncbi:MULTISPECIES: response regulator [Roseivirga]|jgi:DNA-binding response OmpR family regulator|uniref:Response regulatory domain-containing protein n=1 Tax=Roseivirga thermotolerans TaxID=1758176 RepID=A0ABQ3IC01_9BACT|nr:MULTISPECIES: response regulator [Roseivirga]MEC7754556.1 response regulator [Bacteroidota bacterium]GHE74970.1 hypothetical protein GCM10011340_34730 [Roseivirga thermotolerans]|tara:strand:+ start:2150 stop:2515 length:366 start_codon:yes stop_codon:yes gene_type:complete
MEAKAHVLIVDDEEDIGLMLSRLLQKAGYHTEFCTSVAEGRIKLKQKKYDLYFLDLNLSDGSGFDLIPEIRQQPEVSGIIIISAYDGLQERERAKAFEVNAFVNKPFNKKEILEAVSQIRL